MIILNLKDGLGNQMFEYGFARFLQTKTQDRLAINNFFFDGKKRRSYSLHHFALGGDVTVLGRAQQLWYTGCYMVRLFACYPRVMLKWLTSNQRPKDEKTFAYSSKKGLYVHFNTFHQFEILPSRKRNKYIYGNYEHYGYIEEVLPQLRREFTIRTQPSEANRRMLEELSGQEAVCVHIRRGDYLSPQWKMLNVCTFDYYQRAMDEVARRRPNAVFWIFTNTHADVEWIQENYRFRQPVRYVDLDNPDYEELRLMRACRHFVLSNSTFSWWAAVLAEGEDKVVAVPDRWLNNAQNDDTQGLYLKDWLRIPVEGETTP